MEAAERARDLRAADAVEHADVRRAAGASAGDDVGEAVAGDVAGGDEDAARIARLYGYSSRRTRPVAPSIACTNVGPSPADPTTRSATPSPLTSPAATCSPQLGNRCRHDVIADGCAGAAVEGADDWRAAGRAAGHDEDLRQAITLDVARRHLDAAAERGSEGEEREPRRSGRAVEHRDGRARRPDQRRL